MKTTAVWMLALAWAATTGLAQPQEGQTTPQSPPVTPSVLDTHPPTGHPVVPKPTADWPHAKAEDVASVDAIIAAYYASTSGAPGQARDWERFRSLFHPQARLIPSRPTADGGSGAFFLSVDDFVEQNRKYFDKSGFIDREAARRTETFGNIAQVWSTYETRRAAGDAAPYSRGIASIQLLKDGGRWWVVNVFWDFEREGNAVPDRYLTTPKE